MHSPRNLVGTCTGLVFAGALFAVNSSFELDLFERFVHWVHQHEHWEADEIIVSVAPLALGALIDLGLAVGLYRRNASILNTYLKVANEMKDAEAKHVDDLLELRRRYNRSNVLDPKALEMLDRLIVRSFQNLKRLNRRTDISSDHAPLVSGELQDSIHPSQFLNDPEADHSKLGKNA